MGRGNREVGPGEGAAAPGDHQRQEDGRQGPDALSSTKTPGIPVSSLLFSVSLGQF